MLIKQKYAKPKMSVFLPSPSIPLETAFWGQYLPSVLSACFMMMFTPLTSNSPGQLRTVLRRNCVCSYTFSFPWRKIAEVFVLFKRFCCQDFPGGTVVRNPPANVGGQEFESWSGKMPHVVEQLSWGTTITEPAACEPQLLSPRATTTEAHVPRARAPQQEKPPQ